MTADKARILRLRELMLHYGLNMSELAMKTRVSRGLVSKYLNGEASIGSKIYEGISSAFPDVDMNYLYTGNGHLIMDQQEKESIIDMSMILYKMEQRIIKCEERITQMEQRVGK